MGLVKWVAKLSCGCVRGGTTASAYVPKPGGPANCLSPEHYDALLTYTDVIDDQRLMGPDGRT